MDHTPPASALEPDMAASLRLLAAPALAPLFWRPSRLHPDSAWHGHLPFAHWVMLAAAPRCFVELGAHAGVSYAGFCDAVLRGGLDTRCFAVDTWTGDEHAGFYGEDIFADLSAFHDQHYGGFSSMLRCTFDVASQYIPDGSVDLLHIDGRHHYDDVLHDYTSWLPKLSPRAVVLFHDTNVRERDFGVWRLWSELTPRFPSFEFLHEHGLGVLAQGREAPAAVLALCGLSDPAEIGAVRERFALLGERWANEGLAASRARAAQARERAAQGREAELRAAIDAAVAHAAGVDAHARGLQAHIEALQGEGGEAGYADMRHRMRQSSARAIAAELETRTAAERAAAASARADAATARASQAEARAEEMRAAAAAHAAAAEALARFHAARARQAEALLPQASQRIAALAERADALAELAMTRQHERNLLLGSTSWRLTAPVRALTRRLTRRAGPRWGDNVAPPPPLPPLPALALPEAAPPVVPAAPAVEPRPAPPAAPSRPRIAYIAGEPDTPGSVYRCDRMAAAAARAGWESCSVAIHRITAETMRADVVVFWRCRWSEHVETAMKIAREHGATIVFDVDDLMFRPELARIEIIDGIRTIQATEAAVAQMYHDVQRTMMAADICTATTNELARQMRALRRAAYVVPNGFDDAALAASRRLVRERRRRPADGLVRLGYAGGTRTHQKDFLTVAGALLRVLRERPETRLVLFRDTVYLTGVIVLEEFPEFAALAGQIEWRDMVPLAELPAELARFDINLAPLQVGNAFCEAKSELKYFEAALVEVPTVASPTGPYRRAIRDGETGFLPEDEDGWHRALLALVDDPALRARVAHAAYHDALWAFGPRRRTDAIVSTLQQARGGAEASRAFMFDARRALAPRPDLPPVPPAEVLFERDALGDAQVSITIASYNYAEYILEALETARIQTLRALDLIVVDDGSTDESVDVVLDWVATYAERFNRVVVLRTLRNAGLGGNRNVGFDAAETPYVLPLDADNRLLPQACETLLAALERSGAAFAYPQIQQFGSAEIVFSDEPFRPARLVGGNYIDAMALVSKEAWAGAGGYYVRRDAMGWEDYSLWCRLIELGQWGEAVPEVLALYRVHGRSMVDAITEQNDNKREMVRLIEDRHPWLDLLARDARQRGRTPVA